MKEAFVLLNRWQEQMFRTMPEGYTVDPLQTVLLEGGPFHARGHLKTYCNRLEATDRAEAATRLREKYPEEFK